MVTLMAYLAYFSVFAKTAFNLPTHSFLQFFLQSVPNSSPEALTPLVAYQTLFYICFISFSSKHHVYLVSALLLLILLVKFNQEQDVGCTTVLNHTVSYSFIHTTDFSRIAITLTFNKVAHHFTNFLASYFFTDFDELVPDLQFSPNNLLEVFFWVGVFLVPVFLLHTRELIHVSQRWTCLNLLHQEGA